MPSVGNSSSPDPNPARLKEILSSMGAGPVLLGLLDQVAASPIDAVALRSALRGLEEGPLSRLLARDVCLAAADSVLSFSRLQPSPPACLERASRLAERALSGDQPPTQDVEQTAHELTTLLHNTSCLQGERAWWSALAMAFEAVFFVEPGSCAAQAVLELDNAGVDALVWEPVVRAAALHGLARVAENPGELLSPP